MNFVAFDIGNVLVHFDLNKFLIPLRSIIGANQYELFRSSFEQNFQHQHEIGLVGFRSFFKSFNTLLDDSALDAIVQAWNSTISPDEEMLEFVYRLTKAGVRVALLSNIGQEHVENLNKICPELINRTIRHFSCEVGARKPSKLFYQSFLMDNEEFKGCYFFDDRIENCNQATNWFRAKPFSLEILNSLPKKDRKSILEGLEDYLIGRVYSMPFNDYSFWKQCAKPI